MVLPNNDRPGFYRIETLVFPVISGFIPCTHVKLNEASTPNTTPSATRKSDSPVKRSDALPAPSLVRKPPPPNPPDSPVKAPGTPLFGVREASSPVLRKPVAVSDGWKDRGSGDRTAPGRRPLPPLISPDALLTGASEQQRASLTTSMGRLPTVASKSGDSSPNAQLSPPMVVLPNAEEVHRHKVEVSKSLEMQHHPPIGVRLEEASGDHRRARSVTNFAASTDAGSAPSSQPGSPVTVAVSPSGRVRADTDSASKRRSIMRRKSQILLSSHVSKSEPSLHEPTMSAHEEEKERLERYWNSIPYNFLAWDKCMKLSSRDPPLIQSVKGFPIECGNEACDLSEVAEAGFVDEASRTPFYDDHMRLLPHFHWVFAASELSDARDPIVVSCEDRSDKEKNERHFLLLIRADRGDIRTVVSTKEPRKWLKEYAKKTYPKLNVKKDIRELSKEHGEPFEKLCNELSAFEKSNIVSTYKVGVLYWKEGQSENEAFSNQMSDSFDRFLHVLGTRIELKGWGKFKGGLNVSEEASTGKESVFTEFRGFQIMFHVSTLLPLHESDVQKLERKRHIGNDIVIVIFKEGNTPFDPTQLHTQFNHIFIVVEEVPGPELRYRVEVTTKPDVPCFPPRLPQEPLFEATDSRLREWLLLKIVNGERAAMLKAKDFRVKMKNTRRALLNNIVETHVAK